MEVLIIFMRGSFFCSLQSLEFLNKMYCIMVTNLYNVSGYIVRDHLFS